jgi:thiol-disulfide isomerase/thioredoxin
MSEDFEAGVESSLWTPHTLPDEGRLRSLRGATSWLNTEPLAAQDLSDHVVLVDFWTYTCVNWLRTLPYLRAWAARYGEAGLKIVGVHTPEFGFEHDRGNVATQTAKLGIGFPVAIDNQYAIWQEFGNHYWPAIYLADARGRLRFHHFGEGEYEATESAIQQLLLERGAIDLPPDPVAVTAYGLEVAADWRTLRSPETYLGYQQSSGFVSDPVAPHDRVSRYTGATLGLNAWDLSGEWTFGADSVVLHEAGGRIRFHFHARDLNLVMGAPTGAHIRFRIRLDGRDISGSHGTDVDSSGQGIISEYNTYQLVRQPSPIADQVFEIEFLEEGVSAYCFTFG